jgi:hypothetical protein
LKFILVCKVVLYIYNYRSNSIQKSDDLCEGGDAGREMRWEEREKEKERINKRIIK